MKGKAWFSEGILLPVWLHECSLVACIQPPVSGTLQPCSEGFEVLQEHLVDHASALLLLRVCARLPSWHAGSVTAPAAASSSSGPSAERDEALLDQIGERPVPTCDVTFPAGALVSANRRPGHRERFARHEHRPLARDQPALPALDQPRWPAHRPRKLRGQAISWLAHQSLPHASGSASSWSPSSTHRPSPCLLVQRNRLHVGRPHSGQSSAAGSPHSAQRGRRRRSVVYWSIRKESPRPRNPLPAPPRAGRCSAPGLPPPCSAATPAATPRPSS